MHFRKIAMITTPLLTLALHTPYLHAQTVSNAPESDSQIQDIVVTAQKRAQSLSDVGLTVNVVGAQQLERQNVNNVADLTRTLPGLTVATTVSGIPIYTLRGVSFNVAYFGAQPTVSVYIDEAPLSFPVMTQGALMDLERVEVLKGPQGTLFGQNSTAGAINYISAKPTDDFHAGIRASYGSFDTAQAEAYLSGPLGPNLKARLAVSGTKSGPWQRSVTRDAELGDQRKLAARLLLDWQPSEKLKVAVNINGWLDKSDTLAPQTFVHQPNVAATADPALYTSPLTARNARDADWWPGYNYRNDIKFFQSVVRMDYDFSDAATLTSLTNYADVDVRAVNDFAGKALNFGSTIDTGYAKAFSQELRLSGDVADKRIHYLLGASYQYDKSLENYALHSTVGSAFRNVAGIPGLNFTEVVQRGLQSNTTWAGFGSVDWKATDKLTLSAGFRQTHIEHKSIGCTRDGGDGSLANVFDVLGGAIRGGAGLPPSPPIPPGGCITLGPTFAPFLQQDSFKENSFSWRLNANYKVDDDILLYVTASRGFKGGNYPVPAATSYIQLAPVKQEKLTAYEGGTKARLFDRHLLINAAIYYYDYANKQLETNFIDPVFGQLQVLANIPKSSVKGFEIDAVLAPVHGLTISSAVTYADSKIRGAFRGFDVFGNNVSLSGNPFNFAPKWISVSNAEYEFGLTDNLDGFVGGTYTYNSKTYADLADSAPLAIRSFGILDLRAGLTSASKKWEVVASVRNVSNVYTWSNMHTGGDSILRYPNMPRTYGISLSYKY